MGNFDKSVQDEANFVLSAIPTEKGRMQYFEDILPWIASMAEECRQKGDSVMMGIWNEYRKVFISALARTIWP